MNALILKVRGQPAGMWRQLLIAALFVLGGLAIGKLSASPGMIRPLFFLSFVIALLAMNMKQPRLVLYALLLYLPFMTFFRRLLIPAAGWSSFDPLVLLAPFTILLMGAGWAYRVYIGKTISLDDDTRLFRLVRWLLLIHLIQVFNPIQGGILAGLGGIIFYVVPLFWMILVRKHMDEKWMSIVFGTVFVIGIGCALYGLKQTLYGFFDFEMQWVHIAGYAALIVGKSSRSFSFLTSAAEYAQYMIIAIVIAWSYVLRGRMWLKLMGLAAIPLLFYALFMIGSRGPVVLTAVAVTVVSILSVRSAWKRLVITAVAVAAIAGAYSAIGKLNPESSALIAHQVNGLTNPLDEEHSTLQLHFDMMIHGFIDGIKFPIGRGLGSTTLAGAKLGGSGESSEVDAANIFISDGVIGGVIYLLIIFQVMRLAFQMDRSNVFSLAILGILIATAGSWSIGGNYSTCTIIWVCIGFLDRMMRKHPANTWTKESRL